MALWRLELRDQKGKKKRKPLAEVASSERFGTPLEG